jgi:hypothetical protein
MALDNQHAKQFTGGIDGRFLAWSDLRRACLTRREPVARAGILEFANVEIRL